ncbi:hypothetical protein [Chryseobacterium terrae]|uniref:Uncharacterized protein n=1 Tax=Chryseobacterium terrae TaxID=3163299 RepID=A0ABW8Y013_9FLAO
MIKRFFLIVFALCFSFIFSQKNKKEKDLLEGYSTLHGKINKNYQPISLGQRIKNYPFNKASKIKIVSYNLDFAKKYSYEPPPPPPQTKDDSIKLKEFYNRSKPIDFREILESPFEKDLIKYKTLNLEEISKLSHIIFNTCEKYYITMRSQVGCFFPRNAIVFYDEADKVFERIEVCFECGNLESYPSEFLNWKNTCEFIYPELEKFFQSKGLQTQYASKNNETK